MPLLVVLHPLKVAVESDAAGCSIGKDCFKIDPLTSPGGVFPKLE